MPDRSLEIARERVMQFRAGEEREQTETQDLLDLSRQLRELQSVQRGVEMEQAEGVLVPEPPTQARFPTLTDIFVGRTPEGRFIMLDEEGGFSTERSVTFGVEHGFVNVPTMFEGREVLPLEALRIVREGGYKDPDTGLALQFFATQEEAVTQAEVRSALLDQQLPPQFRRGPKPITEQVPAALGRIGGAAQESYMVAAEGFVARPILGQPPLTTLSNQLLNTVQGSFAAAAGLWNGAMGGLNQTLIELGVSPTSAVRTTRDFAAASDVIGIATGIAPGPAVRQVARKTRRTALQTERIEAVQREIRAVREEKLRDRALNIAAREARESAARLEDLRGVPVPSGVKSTAMDIAEARVRTAAAKMDDLAERAAAKVIRSPDELLDVPIWTREALTIEAHRRAVDTAKNILIEMQIPNAGTLEPQRVRQIVADLIATSPDFSVRLALDAQAAGFDTLAEFLVAYQGGVTEAARIMQVQSAFRQFTRRLQEGILRNEPGAKHAEALLDESYRLAQEARAGLTPMEAAASQGAFLQASRLFRKLLVSLPVTASRNFIESGGFRSVLGVANRSIDTTLQRVFIPNGIIEPIQPFDELGRLFEAMWKDPAHAVGARGAPSHTRQQVDRIMAAVPEVRDRLFTAIEADLRRIAVARAEGATVLDKVEAGVDRFFLLMNRTQEFIVRRAVFAAEFDRRLKGVGSSLNEFVDHGIMAHGWERALSEAIEESLFRTFALQPKGGNVRTLRGVARGYAALIEGSRIGPFFEPFPRFLFNAIKLIMENTATGGLRLMAPTNRAKLLEGDFSPLAREITGTAMFATALSIRQGEFPGLKPGARFDEVLTEEGFVASLAPFATLVPHLFLADLVLRIDEGRLQVGAGAYREFRIGLLSSATQAPRLFGNMEKVFDALTQVDTLEKYNDLAGLAGEIASGFTRPLQLYRDFSQEWDEAQRLQRETRGQGFTAPIQAAIDPAGRFMGAPLPERESPTRAATPKTPRIPLSRLIPFAAELGIEPGDLGTIGAGLLSHLTGLRLREPRTLIENQLVRLGFTGRHLSPKTGNKRFDALVARHQGIVLGTVGVALAANPVYKALPVKTQTELLRRLLSASRQPALAAAQAQAPQMAARLKLDRMPTAQTEALFEQIDNLLHTRGTDATIGELMKELRGNADRELEGLGL